MASTSTQQKNTNSKTSDQGWERELIEKLALSSVKEQRRSRRWGLFFKAIMFTYLLALLFVFLPDDLGDTSLGDGKHVAMVELRGIIADNAQANSDSVIKGLRRAFGNKQTAAVILRVNSPGGSPVQSGYINDEIVRLRQKHPDIPLYAVVTDICASGCYYIVSAADAIYADKASVIGSIGVLMEGFGFVDAMKRLGVERRLLTAGENKGFMDPFSPLRDEDRAHVQSLLGTIHQQFIDTVMRGRGDKIKDNGKLFSGLVWTGEDAIQLGLIDALGSSDYVARDIIGIDEVVDFTDQAPVLERFIERMGLATKNTLGAMTIQSPIH